MREKQIPSPTTKFLQDLARVSPLVSQDSPSSPTTMQTVPELWPLLSPLLCGPLCHRPLTLLALVLRPLTTPSGGGVCTFRLVAFVSLTRPRLCVPQGQRPSVLHAACKR